MKILALWTVKETTTLEEVQPLLLEEERFAWRSYCDDTLREHYSSDFPTPAISILEADSVEAARERFANLPLLKSGLITATYYPLKPFKNWEVLFREEEQIGE